MTISDTTPSVTIYYTTNGNAPTTGSSVYSSAISVTADETLEAIAASSNYGVSATGSAAYTIAAATPSFSPGSGSYGTAQSVTISDTTPSVYYLLHHQWINSEYRLIDLLERHQRFCR